MKYLLTTQQLTKQFHKQKAVNNVNLHIPQGVIYGLVGKNGAGKTTLMKMIAGLSYPTKGSITMFDQDVHSSSQIVSRMGILIEEPGLYPNFTAAQNLKIKCLALGVQNMESEVSNLLKLVNLQNVGKKKAKQFSLGMKQRLGIAMALVGEPDLLLLDEPINGLDPQSIVEMRELFLRLNREKNITIVISSHILDELSKLATNYGIVDHGVLLEELTSQDLLEKCNDAIRLIVDNSEKACTVLDEMGFTNYRVIDRQTIEIYERLEEAGAINMTLTQKGVCVSQVSVVNQGLEDYFLKVTGGKDHA